MEAIFAILAANDPPITWIMIGNANVDSINVKMGRHDYVGGFRGDRIPLIHFRASEIQLLTTIKTIPSVEHLDISYAELSDLGSDIVIDMAKNLRKLTFSSDGRTKLLEALVDNESIEVLKISDISSDHADIFANLIQKNQHLKKLFLRNVVGNLPEFFEKMSHALMFSRTLSFLSIFDTSMTEVEVNHISQALMINESLVTLKLINDELTDVSVGLLVELLHSNTSLRSLDLSENSLSEVRLSTIAQALSCNTSLKSLKINNNMMFCGPELIGEFIDKATCLEVLAVNDILLPGVRSDRTKVIIDSLAVNTNLLEFHMWDFMDIVDRGILVPLLESSLLQNTTLTMLDFGDKTPAQRILERNRMWCPSLFSRLVGRINETT